MSKWSEAFEAHEVHTGIDALDSELSSLSSSLVENSTESLENVSRLKGTIDFLRGRFESLDPNLVPLAQVNAINKSIQTALGEVRNFKTNKNPGHLNNASAQADSILTHTANLLVVSSSDDVETLKESISSFRRSAGQNLRYFEEQSKELESRHAALVKQFEKLEGEIDAQKTRLDSAISEFQKQFSEAEQSRRQSWSSVEEKIYEELRETISEGEDSLNGFIGTAREKIEKIISSQSEAAEKHRSEIQNASEALLREIRKDREQAASLVKIIADTGLIGGYQKVADKERNSARLWHGVALFSMMGLIGFAMYALYSTLGGSVDWSIFASKVFVSLTFGIAAAYAAKQAEKHERIERKSRKMELELAAVGPYLNDFPEELQQKIKEQLAHRLFGQIEAEPGQVSDKVTGTSADLLKLALDSIRSLSKN